MQNFICLLIDDDADDREIFTLALEDADKTYTCITANNGIDALEKLNADERFIPDFIFLDLNMPFLSGKQCLMEIKKILRLSGVPVIIYTTSSHKNDIEETRRLGASHFVTKPSSISSLTKILTGLLKKPDPPFLLNETLLIITAGLLIIQLIF